MNISARVTNPSGQYDHLVQPVVVPEASNQSMAGPANVSADTSLKLAGVDPSGEPSRRHRKAAISARVTVPAGQQRGRDARRRDAMIHGPFSGNPGQEPMLRTLGGEVLE
mgnify:CR=1 FL=1